MRKLRKRCSENSTMGWFWNKGLHGTRSFGVKSGNSFCCPDGGPQSPWRWPGCMDGPRLGRASGFEGSWWLYLLTGDTGRAECQPAGSPEELNSPHLGQSQSCRCLGCISGLWRSELWTWSLDSKFSKSADSLGAESGFSYQEMLGALAWLGSSRVVDPALTWVAGGGPDKGALAWQVQEPLQWSVCFLSFTASKFCQNMSVQSHFQHCVLSARWLMENTLHVFARPSDDK